MLMQLLVKMEAAVSVNKMFLQ